MSSIRLQVRAMLEDLIAEKVSREKAAEWARLLVEADDFDGDIKDPGAWDAMLALVMADLQEGPDAYLYGPADFRVWLNEMDSPQTNGEQSERPGA